MPRKTSFYYSFLVLPAPQRRAIISVWDFCRAADDAVDETTDGHREKVCFWRNEVASCYNGRPPQTWQGRQLQPLISEFDLPRQAFEDVIDGIAMDVDQFRYDTFDDLFEYCRRVASAVGMICIRIFGCTGARAAEYALHLGVALQLTNILRDVKDDFARGRVYLPLEDLAAAGCTADDLAGPTTEPVRKVIRFECERARDFYRRAVEARPREDRSKLVAAEIMRAVYFETLKRIEKRDYDVLSGRIRVSRPVQAMIALRQLILP